MTEIRLDVDVPHPPDRLWRAVSDPSVLSGWFLPIDVRPVPGHTFSIEPFGDAFDEPLAGEVVDVETAQRLSMRWRGPEFDARVTFAVSRVSGGCRLTLRQSGFFGMHGLLRRRALHRQYTELLGRRLPECLDQLAVDEGALGPAGSAQARRRTQRARTAGPITRRNLARPFQRRQGSGRRPAAIGRVRVSRPLNEEVTVAFATLRRVRRHSAPRRGRRHRQPEWLLVLIGTVLRGRDSVEATLQRVVTAPPLRRMWVGLTAWLRRVGILPRARRAVTAVRAVTARLASPRSRFAAPAGAPAGAPAAAPASPPAASDGGRIRSPGRRRRDRSVLAGVGMLAAIAALMAASTALRAPETAPASGGDSDSAQFPGRTRPADSTGPAVGSPNASDSGGSAGAARASLSATFRRDAVRVGGYRGAVDVSNPGGGPARGWTVVITLPAADLNVRSASGAAYQQRGQAVTFSPTEETRVIGSGASVTFTFDVDGVGSPADCTIDGRPCTGVPE